MKLRIGLLVKEQLGWELLLDQIGVSYAHVDAAISPEEYSVLVVDSSSNQSNDIKGYLQSGGSVLCTSDVAESLFGIRNHQRFFRYVTEGDEQNRLAGAGMLDLFQNGRVASGANFLPDHHGAFTTLFENIGSGFICVLPWNPGEIIHDSRTLVKSFYVEGRSYRFPFERVSLLSKGALHTLVVRLLEILHARRGIPFIQKWYFPENRPSIFAFRIDTDFGSKIQIEKLHTVARKFNIPFTWFVDVESQLLHLPIYNEMAGHEIGIHCFYHREYTDATIIKEEIARAREEMKAVGVQLSNGFAAPYGAWNDAIAEAVGDCNMEYSSEFSFEYDSYPSYPSSRGQRLPFLQIPIHPISIGSLRRQGMTTEEMQAYFIRVVQDKLARHLPLIFYHHPRNGHEDVLEKLFSDVHELGISPLTFTEYGRWWKKRHTLTFNPAFEGENVYLQSPQNNDSVWFRVLRKDGKEAFATGGEVVNLSSLEWKDVPEIPVLPQKIHHIRKFNPWIPINYLEDKVVALWR